jgi:hypothetical protein
VGRDGASINAHHRHDALRHETIDEVVVVADVGAVVEEHDPLDVHAHDFAHEAVDDARILLDRWNPVDAPAVVAWWARKSFHGNDFVGPIGV